MHEPIFTTARGPTSALQPVRSDLTGLHRAGGWEGKTTSDASSASCIRASAAQEPNRCPCAREARPEASTEARPKECARSAVQEAVAPTSKENRRKTCSPQACNPQLSPSWPQTQVLNVGRPAVGSVVITGDCFCPIDLQTSEDRQSRNRRKPATARTWEGASEAKPGGPRTTATIT